MAIKAGQLKERADYQAYILEMLREENGYQVRPSTAYDPGYGMDVELLFSFLEATQKDALARLEKLYGDKTRQTIKLTTRNATTVWWLGSIRPKPDIPRSPS